MTEKKPNEIKLNIPSQKLRSYFAFFLETVI